MKNRSSNVFFLVITRFISPRPISEFRQALGPILESGADKSGDNKIRIIITILNCPI